MSASERYTFLLDEIERVRDEFQVLYGYNITDQEYKNAEVEIYEFINNGSDLDTETAINVSELLSEKKVEKAYQLLEEEI